MQQLKEKQEQLTKKEEDSPGLNRESRLETFTNKSEILNQSQRTIHYDSLIHVNDQLNDELNKLGERLTFMASDVDDQEDEGDCLQSDDQSSESSQPQILQTDEDQKD